MLGTQGGRGARASRRVGDHYVTGGTNWGGYSLESLIKMVANDANPAQLQFLADTWRRQGQKLTASSDNLQRSLVTLMQFWSGAGAEAAASTVARNSKWISNIGDVATRIAEPVDDSGGALRSAQSTMPGAPKGGFWSGLGTAGGAAAAGFAVGGPFGAAAGAVLGGIASAFGFGNSKKKLKRKAVQTMTRYETAILGIDRATPQFTEPADGIIDPIWNRPGGGDGGVGTLPPGQRPPGGGLPPNPGGGPGTPGWQYPGIGGTVPSFADSPSSRWGSLTGVGPLGAGGGAGVGFGSLGDEAARNSRLFAGGAGGAGLGAGMMPPMAGAGAGRGGDLERGANRFGRAGAAGGLGGYGPGGMGAGGGARKDEDQEHKRRVPMEEDLFTGDLKAAPPVIGL
ncbi:hypothetical protein JOF56_001105 [Kibdelosporangium banguiense]|uniref:PPE family protein n=1 Tax=Kibdelosporangium banguiense TaxID=1365924 RepID=A0ABS4T9E4_9PSEU|nr:hypothetical protein [Kibdelosporangium banguiense]MBP2320720.1 hypothetical protein [Kibdelosporangium banguiense]